MPCYHPPPLCFGLCRSRSSNASLTPKHSHPAARDLHLAVLLSFALCCTSFFFPSPVGSSPFFRGIVDEPVPFLSVRSFAILFCFPSSLFSACEESRLVGDESAGRMCAQDEHDPPLRRFLLFPCHFLCSCLCFTLSFPPSACSFGILSLLLSFLPSRFRSLRLIPVFSLRSPNVCPCVCVVPFRSCPGLGRQISLAIYSVPSVVFFSPISIPSVLPSSPFISSSALNLHRLLLSTLLSSCSHLFPFGSPSLSPSLSALQLSAVSLDPLCGLVCGRSQRAGSIEG